MISLKGAHFPKDVILHAAFFYLCYGVSYRDLEEIMAERGVRVDLATLNRSVVKLSPIVAACAQSKKHPTQSSWCMDESYIRVRGVWMDFNRAVDKHGKTLEVMLSERRNKAVTTRFVARAH